MPSLILLGTLAGGGGAGVWTSVAGRPTIIPADEAIAGLSSTERTITAARLKAAIEALALTDVGWDEIDDMPDFIAAGTTQALARAAIGAGTSSLAIGTSSTTAKPGDWEPNAADIADAGTKGREVLQASNASTIRDLLDVPAVGDVVAVDDMTAYHLIPTLFYTGTVWPSRTVPTGYTGPVRWDSIGHEDVTAPSGASVNDRWLRIKPAA